LRGQGHDQQQESIPERAVSGGTELDMLGRSMRKARAATPPMASLSLTKGTEFCIL
jgi:hypothetical protein